MVGYGAAPSMSLKHFGQHYLHTGEIPAPLSELCSGGPPCGGLHFAGEWTVRLATLLSEQNHTSPTSLCSRCSARSAPAAASAVHAVHSILRISLGPFGPGGFPEPMNHQHHSPFTVPSALPLVSGRCLGGAAQGRMPAAVQGDNVPIDVSRSTSTRGYCHT